MTTTEANKYKVFIPTAGLGTRMGNIGLKFNKSLATVTTKPVISHIVEKFKDDIEIVVALGHNGDYVKDFLELGYPEKKFTFVKIDPFCGPGSGLGLTMLQCKDHLQAPFIFCSNDTLTSSQIKPPDRNWMAYDEVHDNISYRSIRRNEEGKVLKIFEKNEIEYSLAYVGLAGIHDFKLFWKFMEDGKDFGSISSGECYALSKMLNHTNIESEKIDWFDTGQPKGLALAKKYYSKSSDPKILQKDDEAIWFVKDRVIKFSTDKKFISDRVERAKILEGYTPPMIESRENMYCYRKVNGRVLSSCINKKLSQNFFDWMSEFWKVELEKPPKITDFKVACTSFYKDKSISRVQKFLSRYSFADTPHNINGEVVPRLDDLLSQIDWDWICNSEPTNFHGDFHFENILLSETGSFVLLDWRQNFGGYKNFGDKYYDLAKLLHGMIVSHDMVSKDMFDIQIDDDVVKFEIHRKYTLVECEKQFKRFCLKSGLEYKKILVITALIFLNIAALHHDPYSKFLFYLGKYRLHEALQK